MPRQIRADTSGTLHQMITRGIGKREIIEDAKDKRQFVSRMVDL